MQSWTTYKQAALDYSRLKPRRVSATITLVADDASYDLPADCLSVVSVAWGSESTFTEVMTAAADSTTQGWVVEGGVLYLTPAPVASDVAATPTIKIIYYGRYVPNEGPQTFTPAIPATDTGYVDDLEQAIMLEVEADDVAKGPALYTIGQTQVSRVEALKYLRERARELRTRVQQKLDEPLAVWE